MRKILSLSVILMLAQFAVACNGNSDQLVESNEIDVVIVGGGFSGLTAAHYLQKKNVLVLEKDELAGGRCISGHWKDFHYPKGTEYIGKPEQPLKGIIKKLGIKAQKIPAPTDGVAYNGKFYFGTDLLDYLSPEEKKQYNQLQNQLSVFANNGIEDLIFEEQDELRKYKVLDNMSVEQWLNKHNYSNLIQKFVDIENRGLFGTDNANYSMLFNIPEMAFDLPNVGTINKSEVYSFSEGMYSIVSSLANRLGDKLITGAKVIAVNQNDKDLLEVIYERDGKEYRVSTKTVIMATPAPITARILGANLSRKAEKTLTNLKYSKYATINFFTKTRLLSETWSVSCIDEGQVVTLYDATRPQVAKDYKGESILSVYMAPEDAYDTNFTKQSDEELLKNAYATLNKHYPNFEKEVVGYDINRFEYAFPIFSPGYANNLDILLNDRSVNGPIFLAGDYMVYATVDGAIVSAENAAENVLDYLNY